MNGPLFGFKPPSPAILLAVGIIVLLYMAMAEMVKKMFYRRIKL